MAEASLVVHCISVDMSHSVVRILPKYVNCGTLLIVSPAMEKEGLVAQC